MQQKDEFLLSSTIDFLRFALIVAVVFIHWDPGSMAINGGI